MENKTEETTPQNPVVEETPEVEEKKPVVEGEVLVDENPGKVLIPEDELADLKRNADVSSQNFERLKKLEKERDELRTQLEDNSVPSEEEDGKLEQLESELAEMRGKVSRQELQSKHPELMETWDDFMDYHENPENSGMKLETAAKAFLTEKGLLEPRRSGLERATGGDKAPVQTGMTVEQIEELRKSDGQKYREMIKKGQIKFNTKP